MAASLAPVGPPPAETPADPGGPPLGLLGGLLSLALGMLGVAALAWASELIRGARRRGRRKGVYRAQA